MQFLRAPCKADPTGAWVLASSAALAPHRPAARRQAPRLAPPPPGAERDNRLRYLVADRQAGGALELLEKSFYRTPVIYPSAEGGKTRYLQLPPPQVGAAAAAAGLHSAAEQHHGLLPIFDRVLFLVVCAHCATSRRRCCSCQAAQAWWLQA